MILSMSGALEHLALEQRLGELLELVAALGDQPVRVRVGLEGQRLLLLVADAPRDLRELAGVDERPRHRVRGAHPVVVHHRVRDVGDALQVVRRARGDRAEDDLLGDATAEQHRHLVDQLLARLQVAVLVRHVHDVAERLPARDDRDLVHVVGGDQQLARQRVAGLVVGDDLALVLVERRGGLHAGDDALERLVEVAHRERRCPCAARSGSRPRWRGSPGRRRSARWSAGRRRRGRRPGRAASCGCGRRGSRGARRRPAG